MIKINLATKPGLQDETVVQGFIGEASDIFSVPLPEVSSQISAEQMTEQLLTAPTSEVPTDKAEMFESVKENLEMLEQAETEEFIPRHLSHPPEKSQEAIEGTEDTQPIPKSHPRSWLKILIYLLVVIIIGSAGYWVYNKYLKIEGPQITGVTDEEVKVPITESATPTPESIAPSESDLVQSRPNQVDEIYLPNIAVGTARCHLIAGIIDAFPADFRLQYLKLTNEKISFLIYVGLEEGARHAKTTIQNLPGILSTRVFYIEKMTGIPSPAVQIMAILNVRIEENLIENVRFLDDLAMAQTLWAIGKRNNLTLQPLSITEPPAANPRLAGIQGQGSVSNFKNLLNELAGINLNLSVEQVLLNPVIDSGDKTEQVNFTINFVLYPQKI